LSTVLLDASAILAAFKRNEPHHEAAGALLIDDSVRLTTLELARYEVVNAAVCGWRAPELVTTLLGALEGIANDGGILFPSDVLFARATEFAVRHEISVYDAAYVAAAADGDRRLVSCDERDLVSKGLAVLPGDA
jgi:predicted nucleic acid-binding protein